MVFKSLHERNGAQRCSVRHPRTEPTAQIHRRLRSDPMLSRERQRPWRVIAPQGVEGGSCAGIEDPQQHRADGLQAELCSFTCRPKQH